MKYIEWPSVKILNFGKLENNISFDPKLVKMFATALAVRENAQAPYSKFLVGATVESESGKVYAGCNVERCSYSQTTHAEQNAIDSMVAKEGSVKIRKLVVVGGLTGVSIPIKNHDKVHSSTLCDCSKHLVWPCGQCRQIIWENCCGDASVQVYTLAPSGDVIFAQMQDLYPFPFGPTDIGINYGSKGDKNG